jgi:hypothetical protein
MCNIQSSPLKGKQVTVNHLVSVACWRRSPGPAYARSVVNLSSPSRTRSKIVLPLLLLVLLMTQAASTVCGAQCVQHQLPNPSAHVMAHCPSMQQPESNAPELQICQTGTHAICVVDLQANTQGKTASLLALQADVRPGALLQGQSISQFISTSHLLRSSTDSSPLITALRV